MRVKPDPPVRLPGGSLTGPDKIAKGDSAARTDRLVAGDDHGASAESGTPQSPATSAAYTDAR